MRSRRCLGPGRPWGDAEASGRRVTCKAPSADVVGGSGRSEASPTATLQDTHSVEGVIPSHEVLHSFVHPRPRDNPCQSRRGARLDKPPEAAYYAGKYIV